jgi:diguanylate cyclase (GGDEF)-like protein
MSVNLTNENPCAALLFARILAFLLAATFAQLAFAQTQVMPAWQLQYFDGPENCEATEEVIKTSRAANWLDIDAGQVVKREKHIWLRLVTAESIDLNSSWIASIRRVGVNRLYFKFNSAAKPARSAGVLNRMMPEPPFEFATNALALELPRALLPGENWNFCIPVRASVASNFLSFAPSAAYRAQDVRQAKFETACLAIMLTMVLSALFFAITLKDQVYLWYAGHIVAFTIFELRITSEIYRWLAGWPLMPGFAIVLSDVVLGISIFCASRFAMVFLDTARHFPKASVWLARFGWLMLLASALIGSFRGWMFNNPSHPLTGSLPNLQNLVTAIICVMVLVMACRLSWRKSRAANYYLASSLPLVLGGIFATLYAIFIDTSATFTPFLMPLAAFEAVVLSLGMADRALSLRQERDDARQSAEYDLLTGTLNRRGFLARLDQAHSHLHAASAESCALLYCDLDFFKRVNDQYGHEAGDQCLKHFAETIKEVLRQNKDRRRARRTDELGRLGGEEFVVLLYHCSAEDAVAAANRICAKLRAEPVRWQTYEIALTVSIGVAMLEPAAAPQAAIAAADAALYQAKRAGRDRVCLAQVC